MCQFEQIDTRQPERFSQRQELIGIQADTSAERCLKQVTIGRGCGVPFQRAEIRGKGRRVIGAVTPQARPEVVLHAPGTDLGGDFRFSPDSGTGLMEQPDAVLSAPLQRAKKQTRDQIQAIRNSRSAKSGDAPLLITDVQWSALNDKQPDTRDAQAGDRPRSRMPREKGRDAVCLLKRILKLDRLRLRGPCGARDEFHLAATAQNLRKLAKLIPAPP